MPPINPAERQRKYREALKQKGLKAVRVIVPVAAEDQIQHAADALRQRYQPISNGDNPMWTIDLVRRELTSYSEDNHLDWAFELVEGEQPCLLIQMPELGGAEVFVAVSEEQMLLSTLLCEAAEIADTAAFNAMLLSTHKLLPLSTVGLTSVNAANDYYELFGALSSRSSAAALREEIEMLSANYLALAEDIQDYLAAPRAA